MRVRDVMTTAVVAVEPDTPLKDVARVLVDRGISGVPVVDSTGAVLGVVSEADFVARERRAGAEERHSLLARLFERTPAAVQDEHRLAATTAGEAMNRPALTIGPDRSLAEAARIMTEHRIKRLPVVAEGRLLGMVTRADLVRAYVRTDAELLDVVADTLRAVDGLQILGVEQGVVTLGGTVASPELASTIRRLVGRIDGIVAVDDRDLNWRTEGPPLVLQGFSGQEPGMEPGSRAL
jgi:CBS domain-containing protein